MTVATTTDEAITHARQASEDAGGEPLQAVDEPEEGVGRKPADEDKGSSGETAEALFDRDAYQDPKLRIPKIDGQEVDKIALAFSGRILLDRKSPDDVALIRKMALGRDATLRVEAKVSGKKHAFTTDKEGDLDVDVLEHALKVETVYMPEPEEL